MFEYTGDHFQQLCRSGVVRERISAMEDTRRSAVRSFWLFLAGGILLAAAIAYSMAGSSYDVWGWVIAIAVLIGGVVFAILPLSRAGESLKHPVLEALAQQGGMEFLPSGFEPPVYPEARNALFGSWLSGQTFSDLFHGTDAGGQRFALYEGILTRKAGKNTVTVFSGQIYAFQRRSKGGGIIAIVPDRGLFNFFKPAKGMERMKFDGDPEFEKKFEVYASHRSEALGLLGSEARRQLLQLRRGGRVFAYAGPEDMLVAAWGKNRFEAGSMFRSLGGEERVKRMFDEVCESLGILRSLKQALD